MSTNSNHPQKGFVNQIAVFIKNAWKHPLVKVITGLVVTIGAISGFGGAFGLPPTWWIPAPVGTQIARLIATATPTATLTATPTQTSTPTPSPTNTPPPTATALEGAAFGSDVIGVVLADFVNDAPGVDNLGDPLALAFEQSTVNIPLIRVRHTVTSQTEAEQIARLYNATIVVWGEKYSTGVDVHYQVDPAYGLVETTVSNLLIAVDNNFSTFVINDRMGVPYILDLTQGQIFYFDGHYTEARNAFDQAVTAIPKGMEAQVQAEALYFYRGNTLYYLNQKDAALADYQQALKLNPKDALVYNNMGMIHHDQGDSTQALADYQQALQIDPNDAQAYNNRGLVYQEQGDDDDALKDYKAALQLQPDFPEALYNRGNLYYDQGQYDLALNDYNAAAQFQPNNANIYHNRGLTHAAQGDYTEAVNDFTQAIRLRQDHASDYLSRGAVYFAEGDYTDALSDYQTYQQLTGKLNPIMLTQIPQMQAALTATAVITQRPAITATPAP